MPSKADAEASGLPAVPGVSHRFVDIPQPAGPVRIHLAEAGAGEPVLLLHGWPQHWYGWRHLIPEFVAAVSITYARSTRVRLERGAWLRI